MIALRDGGGPVGTRRGSDGRGLSGRRGLGWCLAYIAATTELVGLAGPSERGRLIGTTDLLSSLFGAALALGWGAVYSGEGVTSTACLGGAASAARAAADAAETTSTARSVVLPATATATTATSTAGAIRSAIRGGPPPPTRARAVNPSGDVDEDVLRLRVQIQGRHPELTPDAGHLVAAEGRLGVDR